MKPIKFKNYNCTYAKDQPQYLSLPSHKNDDGVVTSCWKLSFWEAFVVFITGKIYWQQLTFNKPLQPQRPYVLNPIKEQSK